MTEFLKNHYQEILVLFSLLATIVSASFGVASSVITGRAIKKAKARNTFTICPHCHKAIPLSDLDFRLPDGSIDNNLNGVPDEKERTYKK